jgi:hypothetical protein
VSTEQILHPEKYFSNRDLPTKIELPALPESFSAWRELEHNTLGEFNISILIDGYLPADQARLASAGWDGDRFSLYENRDTGQLLLVWDTTWDTEQDAREFFQVYKDVLGKRYKDTALPGDTLSEEVLYEHKLWKTDNGEIYIEIHGTDVLILDGVPEHLLNETISLFR